MRNITFVSNGKVVVAPASYGMIDSSIGGQLARKVVNADGRTARGLVSLDNFRDQISDYIKRYVNGEVTQ